jgi:hypothetical protein
MGEDAMQWPETPAPNPLIETLKEARRLIAEVGHTKGRYRAYDPGTLRVVGYCAAGALQEAPRNVPAVANLYPNKHLNDHLSDTGYDVLERTLQKRGTQDSVVTWNDDLERTTAEVLQLFDDAIKSLEGPT